MKSRLPHAMKGDAIENLSRLIVYAVNRLPKAK
jgi:hypothetical protein